MKILLVIDCPTEFINGVSQSVLNLEKGLTDEGHDVRILMPSPDGKGRIDGNHLLAPSHGFSAVYPGFRFSFTLTHEIRNSILQWKPDIIHSNTEGVLYLKSAGLAKKTGAKHIHSFHTNFLDYYYIYFPFSKGFSQALMKAYGKRYFRKIDAVITPSLWGKHIMERFSFPVPHYVLHNGIHTEIFSAGNKPARERIRLCYGVEGSDTLLIFVGRVAAEKNISELLSDFSGVENKSVKLMITGGGPELESLKREAGLMPETERIIFTDMIPAEHIADYYAAADVFVTASRSEVQPLTYVEAMASGLPVVCADAPYIEGLVINGKTGYAFNSREEFVEAVNTIAGNRELGCRMGAQAKELVVWDYSIKNFAESAGRIYSEVLERKPPVSVNIRSISHLFPGQGVASAFSEHCNLAKKLPSRSFTIRVNSFGKADIVHCHSVEPWNLLYMRFLCKKSVVHCHFLPSTLNGSLRMPKVISMLFNRYVLHFYKAADRLVVVNPSFIPKLTELGVDKSKIVYIPNFVATDGFFPYDEAKCQLTRAELNIPADDFVVLGVGQIMARKGIDDFLALAEKMPDVSFIWCGGFPFGTLTDDYKKWKAAVKNPPVNVRFTGIVPRERMNDYYNACDVFMLPSVDELFPMCILEAAAVGKPVLLRDLPLYEDILFGHFAKAADVEGFAAQVRRLRDDPGYAADMKKESEEIRRMYSEEAVLERLERFYAHTMIEKSLCCMQME